MKRREAIKREIIDNKNEEYCVMRRCDEHISFFNVHLLMYLDWQKMNCVKLLESISTIT